MPLVVGVAAQWIVFEKHRRHLRRPGYSENTSHSTNFLQHIQFQSFSFLQVSPIQSKSIETVSCVSRFHGRNVTSKCQDFQESQLALARYEKMVMDVGRTYGKKRKRPSSKCTWQTLAEALAFEVQARGSTTSGYRKKGCQCSLVSRHYSVFAKIFRVSGELQIIPKQVQHLAILEK